MWNRPPFRAFVLSIALGATACSGGGPTATSAPSSTGMEADTATVARLPPAEFATVVADDAVLTVNVHVPDEGSIEGTDASIPFDEIRSRSAELPDGRGTRLAVYCKTGRMSTDAVATLQDLGYTDIVELRGGMDAWVADGHELLPPVG